MNLISKTTKFIFTISFIIFVMIGFLVSAGKTESFNLFNLWTIKQNTKIGAELVKDEGVSIPALGLALAQSKVGRNAYVSDPTVSGALKLYGKTASLVEVDILQLMRDSEEPMKVFDAHLGQIEQSLAQIGTSFADLSNLAIQYQEESIECLGKKRAGDQEFFQGILGSESLRASQGLETSLAEAPCYVNNRIQSNAYTFMAQRVGIYQRLLTNRLQILTQNRELLLQTYPLLHGNVAEQLVQLKAKLYRVNAMSYAEFDEYFRFTVPGPGEQIPVLQNVLYDTDILPEFSR